MIEETPQKEPLEVSSPEEIRQKSTPSEIVKLPSGAVVKIKKAGLGVLLEENLVSTELLNKFAGVDEKELKKKIEAKDWPEMFKMINAIVKASLIEPRVVEKDPKEGEIFLADLSDDDKFFVFTRAVPSVAVGKKKD